jgi:hypothetical protein
MMEIMELPQQIVVKHQRFLEELSVPPYSE